MSKDNKHYEDVALWAESAEPRIQPGAVIETGSEDAHAEVLAMLASAAESEEDALTIRELRGRPRLEPESEGSGNSPVWRVRAPETLDAQIRAQAIAEGRRLSDVLRQAATEYLSTHQAS